MHRVIADVAIPKTGGSYKPVPNQPPSDRTRAAFRHPEIAEGHSSPDFWILTPGFAPIMQNEPNSHTPGVQPPRISSKRTQFASHPPSRHPAFCRNEPNSHTPRVQPLPISAKRTQFAPTTTRSTRKKCETNPISVPLASRRLSRTTISAKRTQFAPRPPSRHPIFAKRTQSHPGPHPIYAKRTQSAPPAPGGG